MRRRPYLALLLALAGVSTLYALAPDKGKDEDKKDVKRPTLSLKATPAVSFSPTTIHAVGELRGGRDDDEELYCASTAWDWGDGSKSEASDDCAPYEAGKTTIQRRFSAEHVYHYPGSYRIMLSLKRKQKTLIAQSANVQVREGLRGDGFPPLP